MAYTCANFYIYTIVSGTMYYYDLALFLIQWPIFTFLLLWLIITMVCAGISLGDHSDSIRVRIYKTTSKERILHL